MGKDPAFLFYPGDWLGGTLGMTLEQKGAYLELLVMQWNCHRITDASAKRLVGEKLWYELAHKFEADGAGLFNQRLEAEKQKRKKHSESQSINAKKRWSRGNAVAMPLENENRNENENRIKDESKRAPVKKLKPKTISTLFRDSKYFEYSAFQMAFLGTDYETFDTNFRYYHEQILNWSDGKGEKRTDWVAVAKTWIARDKTAGKLITNNHKPGQNGKSTIEDQRAAVQAEFNKRFGDS